MTENEDFAQRLMSARSVAGMSQQALAAASGVAAAQISRYESGRSSPRPEVVAKMSRAIGIDFDWLFTGNGPQPPTLSHQQSGPIFSGDPTVIAFAIPLDLQGKLKTAAEKDGRSLEAEIIARLEKSIHAEEGAILMRGNIGLLRMLADFVVLQHKHPEVMEPMAAAMVKAAQTIKETEDDTKLTAAAGPAIAEYATALVGAVNVATEFLGSGWAKTKNDSDPVRLPTMVPYYPRPAAGKTVEVNGAVYPQMTALLFEDGRLRLAGDVGIISEMLTKNGIKHFSIDGQGVNVPPEFVEDVRAFLGLPEGKQPVTTINADVIIDTHGVRRRRKPKP